ncbi:hypothetical protein LAZ67_9001949 [Cordylochernes scorpioides]|uniref:Uncharacterized protein n=1 Tax=Cordylochernes scorpioides TaxID=51811 RepID=A0ABY6KTG5_9ARAC|nr:hypothetical protein LAZ67_9001949 [Cordylochernes scorpioides]
MSSPILLPDATLLLCPENALMRELPISSQCETEEANLLKLLYGLQLKKTYISLKTKKKKVEAIVFPEVTYGCESLTLRKERNRIEAFEKLTRRKLLRVPWTDKRTNISILNEIKPGKSLVFQICKQSLTYFRQ